jgi:thymidylate synthase ThyX
MFNPRRPTRMKASREWGDKEETPLLRDIAFNRHSMNDGSFVSPYDNATIQVGNDGMVVKLVQGLHPDFQSVLSKATRATIGIDLNGDDGDNRDWEEMLQGGLQTALESQVIVFEVAGASRTATHQIVRSRRAAFHQQSMRASWYGAQPEFRLPESIWRLDDEVRDLWIKALEASHKAYRAACDADASYQDARFILPEGTTNYILAEYSLREFLNVYEYRACALFQHEIVGIMRMMGQILVGRYPFLEPYVKITCEKTHGAKDMPYDPDDPRTHHTCRFPGWEAVEPQCTFPWARDSNRQFRSQHHRIERKR